MCTGKDQNKPQQIVKIKNNVNKITLCEVASLENETTLHLTTI